MEDKYIFTQNYYPEFFDVVVLNGTVITKQKDGSYIDESGVDMGVYRKDSIEFLLEKGYIKSVGN